MKRKKKKKETKKRETKKKEEKKLILKEETLIPKTEEIATTKSGKILKCPVCGGKKIIRDYERGEIVCMNCGYVITESVVDEGPEWRAFDAEQKERRARGGAPLKFMRPNKGLVTEIDQFNKDIRGVKISPKVQQQFYRMRKWQKRIAIASPVERNLAIALNELDKIASTLGLPDNIKEQTALYYRKAVQKDLIKGRLIESVVAAIIYLVCRVNGIPRTLDEIAKASGIEKKEIGRAYRFLKSQLDIKVPLSDPTLYVSKFASQLGVSTKTQQDAIAIIKKAIEKGLISGRGPIGVAAAALYIACAINKEKKTQKDIAEVAGVTEVTIRNRYRELKEELKLDVNI